MVLNFDHLKGPVDTHWIAGQSTYVGEPTDGDDHLFADLGNDWIVGGTGRDTTYNGWGDDLVNVDDVLTTNGDLNDIPDTNPSYEHLAFGGAGSDVLIANTGGDRLTDWNGEFNTYRVPWSVYGEPQVIRRLLPALPEFLYALSQSQGADQTLAVQYGCEPIRNGEPFGELALVRHEDDAWQAQSGSPRDPRAGNSKGKVDVKNSAGTQPLFETADHSRATATNEAELLTDSQLARTVAEARLHWTQVLGASDRRLAALDGVQVLVGNLPTDRLGVTIGNLILIDSGAAGRGWLVDSAPVSNGFSGQMDLLTVVSHELGHVLGLPDLDPNFSSNHLMSATLAAGVRRGVTESTFSTAVHLPAKGVFSGLEFGGLLELSRSTRTWWNELDPTLDFGGGWRPQSLEKRKSDWNALLTVLARRQAEDARLLVSERLSDAAGGYDDDDPQWTKLLAEDAAEVESSRHEQVEAAEPQALNTQHYGSVR